MDEIMKEEPKLNNNQKTSKIIIPTIPEVAFYGLAGDIVKSISPYTEADPVALLINFLTCFGSVVGNRPFVRVGADKHQLRLFSVLVGPYFHAIIFSVKSLFLLFSTKFQA